MALKKSVDTEFGVPATYARVGTIQSYFKESCADVTLLIYADEAARKAEKQPLMAYQKRLTFVELNVQEPTRESVYEALKKLDEWAGAEDC